MPFMKATRVYAVALSFVALFATVANAQTAPTLTATANGVQVTINWNNIPGALGYQLEVGNTPGGSQIGVIQLPASIQRPIIVNAPPATYYLRVRGLAVGISGPASNEATVTAGGSTCSTFPAPTLNSSVNGPAATFTWNGVGGAAGYRLQFGTAPGRVDLEHQLGANVTSYTQNVPFTGTFYARVVAANACGLTATSNERPFTIGNPCATQSPALTASVQGGMVTFAWSGVNSATGVRVELSRNNSVSEMGVDVNPAASSYQHFVPLVGTFYARVVVTTPCGVTASSYVPFTVTNPNGSGPRTPNPAPGTLIPRASLGYALPIIQNVANQYRGDLLNSCREHGGNNIFMFRVVQALRTRDSRWGLNDKRGHAGDLSQDIVAYNPTAGADEGAQQIYIYDFIAGHCTSNPDVWMNDVTDVTWAGGNSGMCGNRYCARWTLLPYTRAGFPPDAQ